MFVSHRWSKNDDELIVRLFMSLLDHTLGSEKRAVQVFLDHFRLKPSYQWQKANCEALLSSILMVPILSAEALQKMMNHDPQEEDNILIEWILALECMKNPIHSMMRAIYPLIFGERNADGSLGDLFSEGIIDRLPDTIPSASIKIVRGFLEESGIVPSSSLTNLTVRGVVKEITRYMGLKGYEYPNGFTSAASEAIVSQVEDFLNKMQKNTGNI